MECQKCGHRGAEIKAAAKHLEEIYDDHYFFGGGSGYPNYLLEAGLLRRHGRSYGALLRRYMQPGSVLDVGSAAGFLLRGLLDSGWTGTGVEPNARMAAYAREDMQLDVLTGSLEALSPGRTYDLVTMIQVVQHFVDPIKALGKAAELTRPEGWWLFETWNPGSLTARVFGRRWHAYSPPSVLHWFTPERLGRLAAGFGFQEAARGRPMKFIGSAHAKAVIEHQLRRSRARWLLPGLKLVPDTWTLPYPANDAFWVLYKRSGSECGNEPGAAQT